MDWRIRRGQHWVILGANGSGKTSLLSALTGYLTPSAGRVEVLDAVYDPRPTGASCGGGLDW